MGSAGLAVGCAGGVVIWDIRADDGSADRRLGVCALRKAGITREGGLLALATDGRLLVGTDGRRLEVWAVDADEGRGVLVQAVEAYATDAMRRVKSLAMHAGKLITGSRPSESSVDSEQDELACEVCVRDVATLRLEHVLRGEGDGLSQRACIPTSEVGALLAERGRVWAGSGKHVVMWGYDDSKPS
jgi:hypothetical protein